jgi:large subunit ribosomal protein L10Ae|eukprot:CAMPEP_0185579366 /NCGR_PEP_ID=MMETSP0434-20130131/14526_1 /TAXON_ID=626734 ORGANISM="Favella taraikaensis, Strain Fe Narragansett Bay" /NCGR_SAMPLE_ID=MMETSP0434 /ASSEMBLY_ACC=CAM_ASM_000379 /LENGTH=216 /DNA_ID=CAMNT_0028197375 /DNA_START=20 /DNA_END=670 /DNA_ORIENTATION=+
MTTKLTNSQVLESVQQLREVIKPRKFRETVELQVALKDYDPAKDKRFVGTVRLPNVHRPSLKICLIADQRHADEAKKEKLDIDVTSLDELKKFNKDKKLVKKWAKQYSLLLASDTVLKKVPTVVGPILTRIGRFPTVVGKESLAQKIVDTRASVKFQLKKVTCMSTAVGTVEMTDDELKSNIMMSLNFLASLLKKGWHNIKSVYIKSTMSPSVKVL